MSLPPDHTPSGRNSSNRDVDLSGQVAVVTGAGRGIGRAIAMDLASAGAAVECLARSEEELRETVDLIRSAGGEADYRLLDVCDEGSVTAAVDEIVAKRGTIHLWVNNAGRFRGFGPVWEVDPAEWWQDVTVNLYGVFLCTRAVLRGVPRVSGTLLRIVNLVGGGTNAPVLHGTGYGSSKAAVARFTEGLAWEVRELPVKVFALDPGFVRTKMTEGHLETEFGRKYMWRTAEMFASGIEVSPHEAGRVVCFLASGRVDALSGHIFSVKDDLEHIAADAANIKKEQRNLLRIRRQQSS